MTKYNKPISAQSIVRSLFPIQSGYFIFNDKLKNGNRSIKVWGLARDKTEYAVAYLNALGFTAKLVTTTGRSPWTCNSYRIHTTPYQQ